MAAKWRLLAVVARLRRRQTLKNKIASVLQHRGQPLLREICPLARRQTKAVPESRFRQIGEDVVDRRDEFSGARARAQSEVTTGCGEARQRGDTAGPRERPGLWGERGGWRALARGKWPNSVTVPSDRPFPVIYRTRLRIVFGLNGLPFSLTEPSARLEAKRAGPAELGRTWEGGRAW